MIDEAKGLRKAVDKVFGDKAAVQRCQWHKRENVVGYLPTSKQSTLRQKLQRAYDQPTYAKAKSALSRIRSELSLLNTSAVGSLDEGFEETLTLHRVGLFKELGRSFKMTNCIENLNALVAQRTDKVDYGKTRIRNTAGWPRRYWTSSRGYARCAAVSNWYACALRCKRT